MTLQLGVRQVTLPEMTEGEQVVEDYVSMRLTLRTHPVALIRHRLSPGWLPQSRKSSQSQTSGFGIFLPPLPMTGSGN